MSRTDRYAVIGNPIAHSRSPQIHALFAHQTRQPLQYDRILADEPAFESVVQQFFREGGRGLNVTVPFKLRAYAMAEPRLSERARAAGAVNTLWQQDGALHGCNTDGVGLVRDLARLGVELQGANVLLIGAGGAARGVLLPLIEAGCARIHIVNRTSSRADELARQFARADGTTRLTAGAPDSAAAAGYAWDLAINATSSSLTAGTVPVPAHALRDCSWAYDMMYGARPTPFMVAAEQAGARTADGLGMLVEQAAESFAIWRGIRPDTGPVLQALRHAIAEGAGPDADLISRLHPGAAA